MTRHAQNEQPSNKRCQQRASSAHPPVHQLVVHELSSTCLLQSGVICRTCSHQAPHAACHTSLKSSRPQQISFSLCQRQHGCTVPSPDLALVYLEIIMARTSNSDRACPKRATLQQALRTSRAHTPVVHELSFTLKLSKFFSTSTACRMPYK